jgi:hypothetical protein
VGPPSVQVLHTEFLNFNLAVHQHFVSFRD